jgi:hypothetical protein
MGDTRLPWGSAEDCSIGCGVAITGIASVVAASRTIHHDVGRCVETTLNGRLQFAGEHTAGAKNCGYMNAGVRRGNRAAHELIKLMALHE